MKAVLRHHDLGDVPSCLRCGRVGIPLVRAHIIDRVFDGLDNAANLAPLCKWCHKRQPIFRSGDEEAALAWFGLAPPGAPAAPVHIVAALAEALSDEINPATTETRQWWHGARWPLDGPLPPNPVEIAFRVAKSLDHPANTTGWAYT